jgi:hypothetical protein
VLEQKWNSHSPAVGLNGQRKDHNLSAFVGLQEPQGIWEPPLSKPLDDAAWQAWVAKGGAQDRRDSAARIRAVKWVCIAGLLAAAGLWPQLARYEVAVRFLVAIGALVLMVHAFETHRYALTGVFGALAFLYNPVMPMFGLSGNWQHALVLASAIPFALSLKAPGTANE